ncbi:MAG: DUF1802 family protein [Leptolyngbya sp. SIO4C1]|nr:DUF1802 family protein [Leptolyngbya sp. SIO4C1]
MSAVHSKPSETTSVELQTALKEWSAAVDALAAGQTLMLLRKGGIRERSGQFTVADSRVLLYPTYEHQQPHLLKPAYAQQVQPAVSGWHPTVVTLSAWAEITHIFQLMTAEQVGALLPFHIWTEAFVHERLRWKPQQPLYVLLLRTYRLATPLSLTWQPAYGGCRSWLSLPDAVAADTRSPAISEARYQSQIQAVQQLFLSFRMSCNGLGARSVS